ncbi:MAG: type II toxin-antitoxin system RelE/ParE family toxin [Gemmataceae bacterium]|nr:type II toxin-antitoxin system RelE/ParE family toxin [Gemmataceae bacterium]
MAYNIHIFPRAMADIRSAVIFRSQRSSLAGARWQARLLAAINTLMDSPERCPMADEAADLGLDVRELLHGRRRDVHRILFMIESQTVHVLRVRHAAQDRLSADDL